MNTHRVAVVQSSPIAFDKPRTLEKLAGLTADAAGSGAKLILFPEAFVAGYPKGLDFDTKVGIRTAAGRDQFRMYYDNAIDVPGSDSRRAGDRRSCGRQLGLLASILGSFALGARGWPPGCMTPRHGGR